MKRSRGVAYLLLLVAVAVLGLVAAQSVQLGSQLARRDAEAHLLMVGAELQAALRSYAGVPAEAQQAPGARGPRTLEELLRDTRHPGIRRHLRQIHADPLSGKYEWGLVEDAAGFVIGVYSLAPGQPIRQAGFEATWRSFNDATSYRDWVFGLPDAQGRRPPAPAVPGASTPGR